MAPRPTKAKKAADVKVVDPEPLKKGRGKAKLVDDAEPELSDPEIVEKAAPEKKKRGRKAAETNGKEELNEAPEQKEPAAKRGKKKGAPRNGNGDKEDSPVPTEEIEQTDENSEPNSHLEPVANGKGKKKTAKKETEKSEKPARGKKAKQESTVEENEEAGEEKPSRGKKAKQESPEENEEAGEEKPARVKKAKQESTVEENGEASEENVKPAPKSRGRKAKTDKEMEQKAETGEDVKTELANKGRKKTPANPTAEPQDGKADEDPKQDVPAPKGRKKTQEEKSTDNTKDDEPVPKGRKKTPAKPDPVPEPEEDKIEEEQNEVIENNPEEKKPAKSKKAPSKKAQTKVDAEENVIENEPAGKKKKVTKKEEKGKGDAKDELIEEEQSESKPKGKKGQKKLVEAPEVAEDEPEDTGEPTNKRRRNAEEAPAKDGKAKAPAKNKASTDYESLDFSNTSKNAQGKGWNFKIASWNVDGIRAWMKKGGLDYIKYEKPDILCLQEVKCSQDKLPEEATNLPGYHAYWLCSDKDGYAGVGIYTTKLAISVQYGLQNEELDSEGRIITAEYEEFYLICTYVPNAGRKLVTLDKRLQWNEEFRKHVKELDKKKPVIICGDMNVAHNEIDLKNPTSNKKNAGFTAEERSGMTELLGEGFVDTYRHMYPDETGAYTFWTYMMNSRAKNTGWRLDYFIVSERLMPTICDSVIRDGVFGSDHCPITLFSHLTSAVLSNLRSS